MAGTMAGRAALVTGGSGGIGAASARKLAAEGAAVVLMGRHEEALDKARAAIVADVPGAEIALFAGDALREADVAAACDKAYALRGRLDYIVATVGGSGFAPFLDTPVSALLADLELNIASAFMAMQQGARRMQPGSAIVCISSTAAVLPFPSLATYCTGKAGLEGLIRTVADELAEKGIRVNAVRPGLTRTNATAGMFASPEVVQLYLDQTPLGRTGEPDDIAGAVLYLLGDAASWVTGQAFAVDGGQVLRRHPDLMHPKG